MPKSENYELLREIIRIIAKSALTKDEARLLILGSGYNPGAYDPDLARAFSPFLMDHLIEISSDGNMKEFIKQIEKDHPQIHEKIHNLWFNIEEMR